MSLDPFSLPLSEPLETAQGRIERREGFILRHAGGIGEATPLPGWTESHEACERALRTALSTAEPTPGDCEGAPAARHGLALALADGAARSEGRPLAAHLAGDGVARERVPVNATLGDSNPKSTAAAAESALADGFDCLKLKVGARDLESDRERLAALRDVAPDATLRLDANAAYETPDAARCALDAFEAFGVEYVEQPLPSGLLSELRDHPVRVAADESLAERSVESVLADGVDVVVLKPMVVGGPERTVAAARTARESGVEAVVTTTIDAAVARLGALHAAATFEGPACGLATASLLARDVAPDPAPVVDGYMKLPDRPGIGVRPAEVRADA